MGRPRKKIVEVAPPKYKAVEAIKSRKSADYRPNPISATLEEAKIILRKRYEKRGFIVSCVRRYDKYWFTVNFEGKGPGGLEQVLANWPYIDGVNTEVEAQKKLRKDVDRILKENRRKK